MQTFLYILWIFIPLAYYLMALWSKLEQSTQRKRGKNVQHEAADLFKTANHLAIVCFITFLVDRYATETLIKPNLPDLVPLPLVQILLLPAVMYVVALIKGKSEPIRIKKAPRPTQNKR